MTVQFSHTDISRRGFMVGAAGFTFAIASRLPAGVAEAAGKDAVLSPWVTISTDDTVAIMSPAAEMGQGSLTSLPLILAEELDADWSKVTMQYAPPVAKVYAIEEIKDALAHAQRGERGGKILVAPNGPI